MSKRIAVVSIAVLLLAAAAAHAGFPGSPIANDIQTWYADSPFQVVVEQKVYAGTDTDAGTYLYQWEVKNDGNPADPVGLGSPLHEWGFTENLNGGPPLANFAPSIGGPWTFSLGGPTGALSNAPYWTSPNGFGPSASVLAVFSIISLGPPDAWYEGQAVDTDPLVIATGVTTGPTPEPCTLVFLGLGLSGAAFIRRFGRRRE